MDAILSTLRSEQDAMLRLLRRMVEAESPSTDKAAVDRLGELVGGAAREIGGNVRVLPSPKTGNHLRIEFPVSSKKSFGQILLLGHLDTVWPLGTLARMPFRIRQGKAFGPGVFDMKSGIVIGFFAVQILQRLGIPLKKRIVMLLNADEEIGSPSSRPFTEKEARRSDAVLVLEPAQGPAGALKTSRKGVGEFRIRVQGRAAHAGVEPEKGASAVAELCRQLLAVERIADPRRGISVSAGIIQGGSRVNVIPEEALAVVDVRISRLRDQKRVEAKLRSLRPYDRRTRLHISGGFNRPPMERTAATAALFERARRLARPLGIHLQETSSGGGSDGNFTAALGVPTLDGLGAVGDGAHALHEHVVVRELPRRAALLAHLIASLASGRDLP